MADNVWRIKEVAEGNFGKSLISLLSAVIGSCGMFRHIIFIYGLFALELATIREHI